jgi:hypothetical protein
MLNTMSAHFFGRHFLDSLTAGMKGGAACFGGHTCSARRWDVALATALGRELGVPMRICNLAYAETREACDRGWEGRDLALGDAARAGACKHQDRGGSGARETGGRNAQSPADACARQAVNVVATAGLDGPAAADKKWHKMESLLD